MTMHVTQDLNLLKLNTQQIWWYIFICTSTTIQACLLV